MGEKSHLVRENEKKNHFCGVMKWAKHFSFSPPTVLFGKDALILLWLSKHLLKVRMQA